MAEVDERAKGREVPVHRDRRKPALDEACAEAERKGVGIAVRAAEELPLSAGLAAERSAFFDLFATEDQREGMRAFMDKRSPVWTGR